MDWLKLFRGEQAKGSASLAKERLQVIVAHQRHNGRDHPEYLPKLQKDLLRVIRKYVQVNEDAVNIEIDREGELEVLELNITLPESGK